MGTEAEAEYRNVTYEEYLQFKEENWTMHCSYETRLAQWTAGKYNSGRLFLIIWRKRQQVYVSRSLQRECGLKRKMRLQQKKLRQIHRRNTDRKRDCYFRCKVCGFRHLTQQFQSSICKYLFVRTGICKIQKCGSGHRLRGCGRQKNDKRVSYRRMDCCFPQGEPEIVINADYGQKKAQWIVWLEC